MKGGLPSGITYSLHNKANRLTKKSERVNGRWLAGLGTGAAAGTAANYLIFSDWMI